MNQVRKKVPLEQHSAVDRQRVFHPGTHAHDHSSGAIPARRLVSASGIYVHDDANTFIDGFAGLYCANVGYGREEIAKAVHDQVLELSYAHTYFGQSHDTGVELARQLMDDWLPSGMAKAYFGMSGSDANETLIKICWYYNNVLDRPKKKRSSPVTAGTTAPALSPPVSRASQIITPTSTFRCPVYSTRAALTTTDGKTIS